MLHQNAAKKKSTSGCDTEEIVSVWTYCRTNDSREIKSLAFVITEGN